MKTRESDLMTPSKRLLFISMLLYGVGLLLPAFHDDGGSTLGILALLACCFPAIVGIFAIPSMLGGDMPLLMCAWIALFRKSRRFGVGFATWAILFGLLFFLLRKGMYGLNGVAVSHVVGGGGCWLWFGSMALALLSGWALEARSKAPPRRR
jgi:hypothetical protein